VTIHRSALQLPRRRWRIAWLLGLGVMVNYFDRVNLSVSHAALYTAYGVSDITFGYLSGAYNWTYALCQLPVGVMLDRFGVRKIGRMSTFLWSIASFSAAVSPSLMGLFGSRLVLGIGEAPTFPANTKAISRWFPPQERSFATSIFDSASRLSTAIGVPVLGIVLIRMGWRWSFVLTGLVSLIYWLLFIAIYRDPEDDAKLTDIERNHIEDKTASSADAFAESAPLSISYLSRRRKVIGLMIGFGSYNYLYYLLLTWLPSYLLLALHIDLLHSFLYTGVPWLFATMVELATGLLVDTLIRRGWDANRVRKITIVCGTACGLGILGAAHAHTAIRALLWISISIGGLSAAAPIGWSIPSIIVPRNSVGTVAGMMNFFNQISGIAAPIVTGYIVAATHSYALAFGIAAAYLFIGISSYVFLLGRIEPLEGTIAAA
jgi:ACS family D-galactonate transporter-like MFS transporter